MIYISLMIALKVNPGFVKAEGGSKLIILGLIADIMAILTLLFIN